MTIKAGKLVEATWMPSPNKGGPLLSPKYIVAHYTAGRSAASSARWLCSPQSKASAHIVIGRDASLFQLVDFKTVAFHAGQSEWKGLHGLNKASIGIELDNCGWLARVGGKWRSLSLGQDYPDADVVELAHKHTPHNVRGWLLYSQAQLAMFEDICGQLIEAYPSIADVIGHDDIAPGRKSDPGPAMPLDVIRSRLFGRNE